MRRKFPEPSGASRYDDGFAQSCGRAMREAAAARERGEETTFGAIKARVFVRPVVTNEDRLTYYRAHGLTDCSDYPGGDAQFESDVLSGLYHDMRVEEGEPKREDAYIIQVMDDGRFRYDSEFKYHVHHPHLLLAYHRNSVKNGGFREYCDHISHGGPKQFWEDVRSGAYARRIVQARTARERMKADVRVSNSGVMEEN